MKDGKKYEGALIISPREKSDELLRFRKEFPEIDFSFMDLKEAEKLFLNQSDSRALRVLLAKGYSLEKSKDILSALRYFKENHGEDEKLKELSSLYKELSEASLLYRDVYPERSFEGKNVVVSSYLPSKHIENFFKGLAIASLTYEEAELVTPPCYVFKDPYAELHYVFNRIAKMIDDGVSPDDIYLANIDDGYAYIIPVMAKAYGFSIAPFSKRRLFDLPLGQRFLSLLDEGAVEEAISKLKEEFPLDPNVDSLERKSLEVSVPELEKEKQKEIYVDLLKSTSERHVAIKNAVRVLNGERLPSSSHVFYLNFSLGKAPHLSRDDGYLSDKELSFIGAPTSSEKNLDAESYLISDVLGGSVEMLSRCRYSFEGETFPSPLIGKEMPNGEVIEEKEAPALDYEYSKDFTAFELANLLDIRADYLIDNPKIDYLKDKGAEGLYSWRSFDPKFEKFDAGLSDKVLTHSYSALDTYFECPFHYYLQKVLKIDDGEASFSARLGEIAHGMLERAYKDESLSFEDAYSASLNESLEERGPLNAKEEFFVNRTKGVLERAFNYQKEITSETINPTHYCEDKVDIKLSEKTNLTCRIDRATVFGNANDKLVITDYKTGSFHFDESLVEYGLGLQLPIYSFAAHKSPKYSDKKIVGLFISRILPNSAIHDKKAIEKHYGDAFKLSGIFLRDISALNEFGGAYLDHIAGSKVKNNGEFQYETAVRDASVFEWISIEAEKQINRADEAIRNSEFEIKPVDAKGKKGSINACDYCPFRDCCYRKDDAYKRIHVQSAKEEAGSEGEGESNE